MELPNLLKEYRYTDSRKYKDKYFNLLHEIYRITKHDVRKFKPFKILIEAEIEKLQLLIKKENKQTRLKHE